MKTLKLFLLVLVATLGTMQLQAQCSVNFTPTAYSGGLYSFFANPTSPDTVGATYAWDFGDGGVDTGAYVLHTFASTGTYWVCVNFVGDTCSATHCDSVNYSVPCNISPNLQVSVSGYDATYSITNGQVGWSYYWTFTPGGDISSSTMPSPTVHYSAPGNYAASLVVTSAQGCTSIIDSINVTIYPSPCYAGWNNSILGLTSVFSPLNDTTNVQYQWNFGDGQTSSNAATYHVYSNPGTYQVCLYTSSTGCNDTMCQTIVIDSFNCHAGQDISDLYGGLYSFNGQVLDSFSNTNNFEWDFGDGQTSNIQNATHTYTTNGTYYACFTYQTLNCSGHLCDSVIVDICNIGNIAHNVYHNSVTYTLQGAHSDWSLVWSFPGSIADSVSGQNPLVYYDSTGTFLATVNVTLPNGCVHTLIDTVVITDTILNPCNASWNYFVSNDGSDVTFYLNDSTTYMHNVIWSFNDGTIPSTNFSPTHYFAADGSYNVCLSVYGNGCSDTLCQNITIQNQYHVWRLSGHVNEGVDAACKYTVYLIGVDSSSYLTLIDSTLVGSDSVGLACPDSFAFSSVFYAGQSNVRYIKVALRSGDVGYANYLPTYYGDELNWADATPLNVTADLSGINITLVAGTNTGGPGFVGGWVAQGAGLTAGSGNNNHRGIGDPLGHVQINLVTDNDVPVAYTYTDVNGRYTFGNLPLGTYKVYAEAIGKTPQPAYVTLTANNPNVDDVDVSINSTSAVTGINEIGSITLDGVFPNPVTDKTVVRFTVGNNADMKMLLTDMQGRVIMNKNIIAVKGSNQIDINLSNNNAGVYQLSLTSNTSKKIVKLVKNN
jgi:PKD repeat protein